MYSRLNYVIFLFLLLTKPTSIWAQVSACEYLLRSSAWVVVPDGKQNSYGAAWVADHDKGYLVTSSHLLGPAKAVQVYFPLYRDNVLVNHSADYIRLRLQNTAKVILTDDKRDLALLQIEKLPLAMVAVPLAKERPQLGQTVYSMGNSGMANRPVEDGTLWHCRKGKILRVGFSVWSLANTGVRIESRTVDTDSAVLQGDSGGPMVDESGQLIGVISSYECNRSKSIEITEISKFLRKARGGNPVPKSPLDGDWTILFQKEPGRKLCFSLTFNEKGKCLWEGEECFPGTYVYDKNILKLNIPGMNLTEEWSLRWDKANHFSFQRDDTLHQANRR